MLQVLDPLRPPSRVGTGQHCHPAGVRSSLSPPHEDLTSRVFGDSTRARNPGWRVTTSCGILSAQLEVGAGRHGPFYPPHIPVGTVPPLWGLSLPRGTATTLPWHRSPACLGKAGLNSKQESSDIPKKPGMERARGHHERHNSFQLSGRFQTSSPWIWKSWGSVLHPDGFIGVNARS